MRLFFAALFCALAALGCASSVAAGDFGATDDGGKFAPRGADAFYARLASLGLKRNTMTIPFDPANPTTIRDEPQIQAALEAAARHDVQVVIAVGTGRARAITGNRFGAAQYVAFLRRLVSRFPSVREYIVGNEGNVWRFWQPQFSRTCQPVSGAAYERLLAASYDALKADDPELRVVGVGLSPRGNDKCHARSNISTSPVRYLAGMGAAYRASGRERPIMDALSFHPYPQSNTDALAVGYRYPNAGVVNLGRIKQAFFDAFAGTAQPTFAEGVEGILPKPAPPLDADPPAVPERIQFVLDEVGWQAKEPKRFARAYRGRENVKLVSEAKQARIYTQLVQVANCDPTISSLSYFHLDDESDRDRFQSGLFRADLSPRPSAVAVKRAIQATRGRCAGKWSLWSPADAVVGARVTFRVSRTPRAPFTAVVEEDAVYRAGVFRVDGPSAEGSWTDESFDREQISRMLQSRSNPTRLVLSARGSLPAYRPLAFRLRGLLRPGSYVYAVLLAARYNADRTSLFVSSAFAVE